MILTRQQTFPDESDHASSCKLVETSDRKLSANDRDGFDDCDSGSLQFPSSNQDDKAILHVL